MTEPPEGCDEGADEDVVLVVEVVDDDGVLDLFSMAFDSCDGFLVLRMERSGT